MRLIFVRSTALLTQLKVNRNRFPLSPSFPACVRQCGISIYSTFYRNSRTAVTESNKTSRKRNGPYILTFFYTKRIKEFYIIPVFVSVAIAALSNRSEFFGFTCVYWKNIWIRRSPASSRSATRCDIKNITFARVFRRNPNQFVSFEWSKRVVPQRASRRLPKWLSRLSFHVSSSSIDPSPTPRKKKVSKCRYRKSN